MGQQVCLLSIITIVWQDSRNGNKKADIYMYDLSTKKETKVSANNSNHYSPAIYGSKIVWMKWYAKSVDDFVDGGFYIKDLSTKKQSLIMTFSDSVNNLAIYGNNIVFEVFEVSWPDINLYNVSTKKLIQISNSPLGTFTPAIYGDKVVWSEENNDVKANIYMYDLSSSKKTQITTTSGSAYNPDIYGNRVVWQDNRNGNWDIYMYDLSTKKETRITTNSSDSENPAIYDNNIVWQDNRNGNWDIYVYDLKTHQQIHTTDKSDQFSPDIYGNRIVWSSGNSDSGDIYDSGNIYTGTISYLPVAAFSASPTSGKAPLTVTFTDKSTGTPTKWKWTFGDGTISTKQNPVHKYLKAGKYTVKLTVKNAAGSNTKTISGYIKVSTK
jgi:beta propeller repeat protein